MPTESCPSAPEASCGEQAPYFKNYTLDCTDLLVLTDFFASCLKRAVNRDAFAALSTILVSLKGLVHSYDSFPLDLHAAYCERVIAAIKLEGYCIVCFKRCEHHDVPSMRISCPRCQTVDFCSGFCSLEEHSHPCEILTRIRMMTNFKTVDLETARLRKDSLLERLSIIQADHDRQIREQTDDAERMKQGVATGCSIPLSEVLASGADQVLLESDKYIIEKLLPVCNILDITRKSFSDRNPGFKTDLECAKFNVSTLRIHDPFTYSFVLRIAHIFSGGIARIRDENARLATILDDIRQISREFSASFVVITTLLENVEKVMLAPCTEMDLAQLSKRYTSCRDLLIKYGSFRMPRQCRAILATIERKVMFWHEVKMFNFLCGSLNKFSDTLKGIDMYEDRLMTLKSESSALTAHIASCNLHIEQAKEVSRELQRRLELFQCSLLEQQVPNITASQGSSSTGHGTLLMRARLSRKKVHTDDTSRNVAVSSSQAGSLNKTIHPIVPPLATNTTDESHMSQHAEDRGINNLPSNESKETLQVFSYPEVTSTTQSQEHSGQSGQTQPTISVSDEVAPVPERKLLLAHGPVVAMSATQDLAPREIAGYAESTPRLHAKPTDRSEKYAALSSSSRHFVRYSFRHQFVHCPSPSDYTASSHLTPEHDHATANMTSQSNCSSLRHSYYGVPHTIPATCMGASLENVPAFDRQCSSRPSSKCTDIDYGLDRVATFPLGFYDSSSNYYMLPVSTDAEPASAAPGNSPNTLETGINLRSNSHNEGSDNKLPNDDTRSARSSSCPSILCKKASSHHPGIRFNRSKSWDGSIAKRASLLCDGVYKGVPYSLNVPGSFTQCIGTRSSGSSCSMRPSGLTPYASFHLGTSVAGNLIGTQPIVDLPGWKTRSSCWSSRYSSLENTRMKEDCHSPQNTPRRSCTSFSCMKMWSSDYHVSKIPNAGGPTANIMKIQSITGHSVGFSGKCPQLDTLAAHDAGLIVSPNTAKMSTYLNEFTRALSQNTKTFMKHLWKLVTRYYLLLANTRKYFLRKCGESPDPLQNKARSCGYGNKQPGAAAGWQDAGLIHAHVEQGIAITRRLTQQFHVVVVNLRFTAFSYKKLCYMRLNMSIVTGQDCRGELSSTVISRMLLREQDMRLKQLSELNIDTSRLSSLQRLRLYCALCCYIMQGDPFDPKAVLGALY